MKNDEKKLSEVLFGTKDHKSFPLVSDFENGKFAIQVTNQQNETDLCHVLFSPKEVYGHGYAVNTAMTKSVLTDRGSGYFVMCSGGDIVVRFHIEDNTVIYKDADIDFETSTKQIADAIANHNTKKENAKFNEDSLLKAVGNQEENIVVDKKEKSVEEVTALLLKSNISRTTYISHNSTLKKLDEMRGTKELKNFVQSLIDVINK